MAKTFYSLFLSISSSSSSLSLVDITNDQKHIQTNVKLCVCVRACVCLRSFVVPKATYSKRENGREWNETFHKNEDSLAVWYVRTFPLCSYIFSLLSLLLFAFYMLFAPLNYIRLFALLFIHCARIHTLFLSVFVFFFFFLLLTVPSSSSLLLLLSSSSLSFSSQFYTLTATIERQKRQGKVMFLNEIVILELKWMKTNALSTQYLCLPSSPTIRTHRDTHKHCHAYPPPNFMWQSNSDIRITESGRLQSWNGK